LKCSLELFELSWFFERITLIFFCFLKCHCSFQKVTIVFLNYLNFHDFWKGHLSFLDFFLKGHY
jgi:hypothetical protein